MKHLRSLREFIEELKKIDDLQPIDLEVDWNLEIGAIIRHSYDLRAPAPLFNNIKDYEKTGFRILGAPGALSAQKERQLCRMALALGLPANASGQQIMEALVAAHERKPLPPKMIDASKAPCKENIQIGDEIDLFSFPTPMIHGNDGGRYLQTYGINIVATPDGNWTNWSVNRMMIVDNSRLSCLIPPLQHLGIIRAKWAALHKPMPIVLALGVEPAIPFVGAMPLPEGVDESHYLGAHFGEPLEVVKAETVDLPVPATAEIVIEGHISVTDQDLAMEGPMNEYPGYNAHDASPKPVFHVSAITYRNNAILPVVAAGPPVEEDHTATGTMHAAEILYNLRQAGLPVSSCWFSFESANHWLIIAAKSNWHEQLAIHSKDLAQKIGEIVFTGKTGFGVPKILLVEDDIDITDINQVVWAFSTRAHPSHGEIYFPAEPNAILFVYLDPTERSTYKATKVIHNCLLADRFSKEEMPVKGSFENGWPLDIQQKVLRQWERYGYHT